MKGIRVRSLMVLLVCTTLSTGYALAENHGRERRERERRHEFRQEMREREAHRDRERERREMERRHERRERWERSRWEREHRDRMNEHRPAGWDRGRKTGWGDRDVPPGQAKKIGYYPDHSGWQQQPRHPEWQRPSAPGMQRASMHRR